MQYKLSPFERRMEMLSILRRKNIVKRSELAEEFNVSIVTISGDLIALSRYAPICTKTGPYGGIYLVKYGNNVISYLSDDEKSLLQKYMMNATNEETKILKSILHKFALPQS